jgi:hypothetical protein
MKTLRILIKVSACSMFVTMIQAQGTFFYDQQSSDESQLGGGAVIIQASQPLGQSFAPSLAQVGFIRLYLSDAAFDGLGATIRVNLRTNSVSGPILGVSDPVFVSDRFIGPINFFFPSMVSVTPEAPYYFQPEVVSGGNFQLYAYNSFGYPRGNAFYQGVQQTVNDLWFREGIIVPEPSVVGIFGLAAIRMAWTRRRALRTT